MSAVEQEEYKREEIKWEPINFKNNQHTIDYIEKANNPQDRSIFKLLDDSNMMQARGTDDYLLQEIKNKLMNGKIIKEPEKIGAKQFTIVHYAGSVTYDIEGFVEKNKDAVSNLITELMVSSSQPIIE